MRVISCDDEDAFIKSAWLEWIVTHLMRCGDGASLVPAYVEVEDWFRLGELGLGKGEGPTVFWTTVHLVQINRAHHAMLACRDLPQLKRERELDEAAQRRKEWRAWQVVKNAKPLQCAA
jgi:hypothetical protein